MFKSSLVLASHLFSSHHRELYRRLHTSSLCLVAKVDYYKVLGVTRNASQKDIKKSYIELAKKYHPDINPGNKDAAKLFQDIAVAYTVLSNKEKRSQYDAQFEKEQNQTFESFRRSSASYQSPYETFHSSVNPEELFRKIFGTDFQDRFTKEADREWIDYSGTEHGHAPTETTIIRLTFREAAKGCEKLVEARTLTVCEKCMGIGSEPGKSIQVCPFCEGLGFEIVEGVDERFRVTCRFCNGKGHNVVNKCNNCLGYGRTLVERKIIIPVPPGVTDGETFKVNVDPSEGDFARGTIGTQQIYIKFLVESSEYFSVDGTDLHSSASISIPQAVFGGEIIVDGLWSEEKITIPHGSDSHTVIKLDNKGLKDKVNSSYGNHYVHLKIIVPKKLTTEETRFLQEYAKIEDLTNGSIHGIQKGDYQTLFLCITLIFLKFYFSDTRKSTSKAGDHRNTTDPDISDHERLQQTQANFSLVTIFNGFIGEPIKNFYRISKVILGEFISKK